MSVLIAVLLFVSIIVLLGVRNYLRIKKSANATSIKAIVELNDNNFKKEITNGVVLVDFWADWCVPCKVMIPTLNEVATHYGERAKVAKLEVEKFRQMSNVYNIRALPTLILFKDGKEIERFQGVKSSRYLINKMDKLLI